ncbi:MAG: hypothetical protein R2879_07650 [Saprospiraceae bacterium]
MNLKYSFSILAFSLFFLFPGNPPSEKKGGLALYTVGNLMKEDPKGVLKKVAEIGYEYMEDAGYSEGKFYGIAPRNTKHTSIRLV